MSIRGSLSLFAIWASKRLGNPGVWKHRYAPHLRTSQGNRMWGGIWKVRNIGIVVHFKNVYGEYIDGLVQDCSISNALAMEILQSKPSIYGGWRKWGQLREHLHWGTLSLQPMGNIAWTMEQRYLGIYIDGESRSRGGVRRVWCL